MGIDPRRSALVLAFGLLAVASRAGADPVVRNGHGDIERWSHPSIDLVYDAATFPPGYDTFPIAIERAAATWNAVDAIPRIEPRAGSPGAIGFDPSRAAANRSGVYVTTDGIDGVMFDALAVTLVTTDSDSGEILDTDVVFNARDHRFALLADGGMPGVPDAPFDSQNVVTHEFGHVLGLGEDVEHRAATMYPTSRPGEVQKRDLEVEDITAIHEAYAAGFSGAQSATSASSVGGAMPAIAPGCGGAHVAPANGSSGPGLAIVAFVMMAGLLARALRPRRDAASRSGNVRRRALRLLGVAAAMLSIGATADRADVHTASARVVVARTASWRNGVIHTRATLRDADGGEVAVDAIGGRIGRYVMHVYGALDGADLEPGAVVTDSHE